MRLTLQQQDRPSRLSTATTEEPCVVCGRLANQQRYVLHAPGIFRFFRACCGFHAAQHQRSCRVRKEEVH